MCIQQNDKEVKQVVIILCLYCFSEWMSAIISTVRFHLQYSALYSLLSGFCFYIRNYHHLYINTDTHNIVF